MKKIILIIVIIFLSSVVSGFDATRIISGNDVSVDVDVSGTTGFIVDEVLPVGVIPSNIGQGGVYTESVKTIRWTKSDNSVSMLTYSYLGVGTVSGVIYGGDPPTQKTIGGDVQLGEILKVKINEFESNPDSGKEWIELYNFEDNSVDISGWKLYDGLSSPSLIYTIPASTIINSKGYYVIELSSSKLNNGNEFVTLKDSNDIEIDKTPTKADSSGDSRTWQRIPNGVDTDTEDDWEFKMQTKGISNDEEEDDWSNDLEVNYVRGVILIDDVAASSGTSYRIEVLSGENMGYVYSGVVDDNIPDFLKGNGYYDSGDQVGFNSGDSFKLIALNNCNATGVFEDGGNGDFVTGIGLINLSCYVPVNNPPVLEMIEDIEVNETELITIIANASDLDGDDLSYSINSSLFVQQDNIFTWQTGYEDSGVYSFEVVVSDGSLEDSQVVNVVVNNVNRAPVLESISKIEVLEGKVVEIILNASDLDGDDLSYSINSSLFVQQDNIFRWQTDYNSGGSYNFEVSVSDGDLGDLEVVEVIIIEDGHPILELIPEQYINEDDEYVELDVLNFSDPDGEIVKIEVSYENRSEVDCEINNNKLGFKPALNFFGDASCNISIIDNEGLRDEEQVIIHVSGVNDGPSIDNYSPLQDRVIITEDGSQGFSVVWSDVDSSVIERKWFLDDVEVGANDNYVFSAMGIGSYNVTVRISDSELEDSKEWSLIASDVPITEDFTGTDFSGLSDEELSNLENVVLENENGKIEFLEALDLRDVVDIDNNVKIENGVVGINIDKYMQLKNKRARITLYNQVYSTLPKIYYTDKFTTNPDEIDKECDFCSLINYTEFPTTNGIVIFEVDHFSSYTIKGSGIKYDIDLFDSLDRCEEGIQGDLVVEIKEPDNNDDFKMNEMMEIEVEVENDNREDKDVVVEAILYNIDEDDEIESVESDEEEVSGEDDERFELELEIPRFDERDEYVLFVKAYEDGNEDINCNYDIIKVDLEREKHEVVIKKMEIMPSVIPDGGGFKAVIEIENIGEKDEDVYVKLINEELDIDFESGEFEIEKDEKIRKSFGVLISEDIEEKDYDLEARVYFSDGRDSKSGKLSVEVSEEAVVDNVSRVIPIKVNIFEIEEDILDGFVETQNGIFSFLERATLKLVGVQNGIHESISRSAKGVRTPEIRIPRFEIPSYLHSALFIIVVGICLLFLYMQI